MESLSPLLVASILGQGPQADLSQPPQPQMGPPQMGQRPSKGALIAGILADMIAGATGRAPVFAPALAKQREAEQERVNWGLKRQADLQDYEAKQKIDQRYGQPTASQQDYQYAKSNGFPGSFTDFLQYTHPPSPVTIPYGANVQAAPTADGLPMVQSPEDAAKLPPGTKFKISDGRIGTVPGGAGGNTSGGFLGSPFPDIGPYKRY